MLQQWRGAARVIAGGTDVLPDIRRHKWQPECLVDITGIPELGDVRFSAEWIEVGAAVTFADLLACDGLEREAAALVPAARSVGAPGIQHQATWIGNIVQSMPAADGAIVALALEAEVCIVDAVGTRWQPVETVFTGPGVCTIDPTSQLITHIRFPRARPGVGTAWRRVARRATLVLPIVNCAVKVVLNPDEGDVAAAVIAMGPVAPRPFRARSAEAALRGGPPTQEMIEAAAWLAQEEADPRSNPLRASRTYRLSVIPVLVEEALTLALDRARDSLVVTCRRADTAEGG